MDLDDQPQRSRRDDAGHLVPNGDTSRFPDTVSTPGSTAQSATTPAVHETSTDTSPDNEGPQYVEREDEKAEPMGSEGATQAPEGAGQEDTSDDADASTDSLTGASGGVEAQLLEESASVQLSRPTPAPEGTPTVVQPKSPSGIKEDAGLAKPETDAEKPDSHMGDVIPQLATSQPATALIEGQASPAGITGAPPEVQPSEPALNVAQPPIDDGALVTKKSTEIPPTFGTRHTAGPQTNPRTRNLDIRWNCGAIEVVCWAQREASDSAYYIWIR